MDLSMSQGTDGRPSGNCYTEMFIAEKMIYDIKQKEMGITVLDRNEKGKMKYG